MSLKKLTEGPYKGQYQDEAGVIYNEKLARQKYPSEFPAKKAAKKRTK